MIHSRSRVPDEIVVMAVISLRGRITQNTRRIAIRYDQFILDVYVTYAAPQSEDEEELLEAFSTELSAGVTLRIDDMRFHTGGTGKEGFALFEIHE